MRANLGASQLFVILGKTSKPSESLRLLQDFGKTVREGPGFHSDGDMLSVNSSSIDSGKPWANSGSYV
jgi:hypothetical protein